MQSTDPEIWRPIVGYEGLYEVSDQGSVRSLARKVPHAAYGTQPIAGRILRQTSNGDYVRVSLLRCGRQVSRRVHVLVAEAFHGARPEGLVVRHLNGDSNDNRASNLTWGTQSDNLRDEVRHGTHHQTKKTHCPRRHKLESPNIRASDAAKGHRSCQACSLERWAARRQGRPFDPSRADERYREIMGGTR